MTPLPPIPRFRRLVERLVLVGGCVLLAACASSGDYDTDNPDWAQAGLPPPPKVTRSSLNEWTETPAPPPPSFNVNQLTSIEMPPYMTLKFGVDMRTVTITDDGIVRYVVVASNQSGGAVNAFYEGVRCKTSEMKSYARYNNGAWQIAEQTEWKPFRDMNSSYTSQLAFQGLCRGSAPRASVNDIARQLRNPIREVE